MNSLCLHEAFRKSVARPNETYKTNLNPSELLIWSHQGAESPKAQTTAPRPNTVEDGVGVVCEEMGRARGSKTM